jgi:hypothetical protein
MGDVSAFMKLVKQRFSIWYNRNHQRFGTLWAERFKSVLVEGRHHALRTVSAYIDLNAVRAGLVEDPAAYRFCGYGEAVGGSKPARVSLRRVVGGRDWRAVQSAYRLLLMGAGNRPKTGAANVSEKRNLQTIKQDGVIPVGEALRHRVRYFTQGLVLGSQSFVREHLRNIERIRKSPPAPLPDAVDWGDLMAGRRCRSGAPG